MFVCLFDLFLAPGSPGLDQGDQKPYSEPWCVQIPGTLTKNTDSKAFLQTYSIRTSRVKAKSIGFFFFFSFKFCKYLQVTQLGDHFFHGLSGKFPHKHSFRYTELALTAAIEPLCRLQAGTLFP